MFQESTFIQRGQQFKKDAQLVDDKLARIAWLRLLVAAAGISLEVYSWRFGGGWWMLALLPTLIGFGVLIKWNQRVEQQKKFLLRLAKINEQEPVRLSGTAPEGEGGASFTSKEHPYSSDLDLFGHKSLFALLDRSSTPYGRDTLANWLLNPADGPEILGRQQAVVELGPRIDWRQQLQATGQEASTSSLEVNRLKAWLNADDALKDMPWLPKVAGGLSVLFLVVLGLSIIGLLPWWAVSVQLILHFLLNRRLWKTLRSSYLLTDQFSKGLTAYAGMLELISKQVSVSSKLKSIQEGILTEGRPAQVEIKRLSAILERLELHMNALVHFFVNNVFFWDIHALAALDNWKRSHSNNVVRWFEAIGEMEALCGMAALQSGGKGFCVPEIVEGGFNLEMEEAGHPLIPEAVRVRNKVDLKSAGMAWLITGSNMSGKSTYLRTVGINSVLAMAGAPVCAEKMRVSPLRVASSMRVSDSLEENTSSFYAELKRIKQVIRMVTEGGNTLFLLDEILKGTNSQDRHAGARALIRQLVEAGGTGLVSTHDLELQDMAGFLQGRVLNMSFWCDVQEDGTLNFDYKLREGVCQSMNATALMRAMGIQM